MSKRMLCEMQVLRSKECNHLLTHGKCCNMYMRELLTIDVMISEMQAVIQQHVCVSVPLHINQFKI